MIEPERRAFAIAAVSSLAPPGATSVRPTKVEQLEQQYSRAVFEAVITTRQTRAIHDAVAALLGSPVAETA